MRYALKTFDLFSLVFERDDLNETLYVYQEFYITIKPFEVQKRLIGKHPNIGTWFEKSEMIYFKCAKQVGSFFMNMRNVFAWEGNIYGITNLVVWALH